MEQLLQGCGSSQFSLVDVHRAIENLSGFGCGKMIKLKIVEIIFFLWGVVNKKTL